MKTWIFPVAAIMAVAVLAAFAGADDCPSCMLPYSNPPSVSGLPDQTVMAGQTTSLLDLFIYASDQEDPDASLSFSIDYETNTGVIDCYITGSRYVGCSAAQSAGHSDISVRVTDTGGLYDTDTFRLTVQSQPPPPPAIHSPAIDSIIITPFDPKDSDDLTCRADVSDQDGNLERVVFRWFVDGALEDTRTIYASGSSANVQDSLESDRTGIGDDVRCEARVYDAEGMLDTDSDSVTIERQDCGVDVYSLQVSGNIIRFWIRNIGEGTENIEYTVYVDGDPIAADSATLDPGEIDIGQKTYPFSTGEYLVKVRAVASCGLADSEIVLHEILEPPSCTSCPDGDGNPVIESVRITPSDPEDSDDLTCEVEARDSDGDLDEVQFRWYVEGDLERTRTASMSGSSDTARDTLASEDSSTGDEVRCSARVLDEDGNQDSDSDVVTIEGASDEDCGVDVSGLEFIDNNEIRFRLRNTGQDTENIHYRIYVESELIDEHAISLDDGESETIEKSFSFVLEDSLIKVKATADCGSTDSEFLSGFPGGRCEARYLDENRCSGSWTQREYQQSDCSIIWVNAEYCSQGCSGGFCSGGGQCGVSIQKFEYQTNTAAGSAASVNVEARNTGSRQETITISLFVDGQLKGTYPAAVSPGSVSIRLFYHYPAAGTHQILVRAEANCGSSDTRTATINVLQPGIQPPYPYPPAPQQPEPSLPTSVSIYPSSLDTSFCEAKFVTIDVHSSRQQVFTIKVSGIPENWLSYQSQSIVEKGDRKLYVFVGPKEAGTHSIRVDVKAEGENLAYSQNIGVYTSSACPIGPSDVTGGLIEVAKNPFFWMIVIIIAAGAIIFIGAVKLRPDVEYCQPQPPPAKPVYYRRPIYYRKPAAEDRTR